MNVQVDFIGEPFDRLAVIHTLRHLALRVGWTLTLAPQPHRIVYATLNEPNDDPREIATNPGDIVIVTSHNVKRFITTADAPIPLSEGEAGRTLPFEFQGDDRAIRDHGWLNADVVAGAWAVMNLWYETRTRASITDGWICWRDDWWSQAGFAEPIALADEWLDEILEAAIRLGWMREKPQPRFLGSSFVVVLTHDVDYLPGEKDLGFPRFLRAVARQLWHRQRYADAGRLIGNYARHWHRNPYWTLGKIAAQEKAFGARSSFQFVVAPRQRFDPSYKVNQKGIARAIQEMAGGEWEVCLHGSYGASRTNGQLALERQALEQVAQIPILGHRQHYLNFYPPQLFDEIERSGFAYDSSVGYNDAPGVRAGTFYPYRPYDITHKRPFSFWEIPFVLMDTTLATTFCDSEEDALRRAQRTLEPLVAAGGCAAIIWHAEQSSGVLDPGYEQVYPKLLEWIRAQGGVMVSGRALPSELDARWQATWGDA